MKIGFIYITENAHILAKKSLDLLKEELDKSAKHFLCGGYPKRGTMGEYYKEYDELKIFSFSEYKLDSEKLFKNFDALIFIMAIGIVVRSISKLIRDKFDDPAIIVMDELGKNVISLLSGHIGGANELTEILAGLLNSNPVITTATDINNKGAFDLIVKSVGGYVENFRNTSLKINSDILRNRKISIYIDPDFRKNIDNDKILKGFSVVDDAENFFDSMENFDSSILISDKKNILDRFKLINDAMNIEEERFVSDNKSEADYKTHIGDKIKGVKVNTDKKIIVVPRLNVLGVGCRKDTDEKKFEDIILKYIDSENLSRDSFFAIGSIDIKKDERCIRHFAEKYGLDLKFFSVDDISQVEGKYYGSEFVKKAVGVVAVSEPVSDILSGGNVISKGYRKDGITLSIGRKINHYHKNKRK